MLVHVPVRTKGPCIPAESEGRVKPRLYGTPPKCSAHGNAGSGLARYHTDGCVKCAELRAKGIVKPNAADVPARKRGGMTTAGLVSPRGHG